MFLSFLLLFLSVVAGGRATTGDVADRKWLVWNPCFSFGWWWGTSPDLFKGGLVVDPSTDTPVEPLYANERDDATRGDVTGDLTDQNVFVNPGLEGRGWKPSRDCGIDCPYNVDLTQYQAVQWQVDITQYKDRVFSFNLDFVSKKRRNRRLHNIW
uniref:Putative secretory peptide-57 n=1 Tax=Pleurobrachia bachei TaxID=34499 RepID=M4H1E3_PLEBA|nr:putative secretory peptide-57 [Pleurobrachia bachei]